MSTYDSTTEFPVTRVTRTKPERMVSEPNVVDRRETSSPGVRLEIELELADRVVECAVKRLHAPLDSTLYALVTYPARWREDVGRRARSYVTKRLKMLEEHYDHCLERLTPLLALDPTCASCRVTRRGQRVLVRSPQARRLVGIYVRADRVAEGITRLWINGHWSDEERSKAVYVLVKRPLYATARDLMGARRRYFPVLNGYSHVV